MDIRTAKRLAPGSAFWSPSRNSHDPSGWRLQIVLAFADNKATMLTGDEHGYQSAWMFAEKNLFAGCLSRQPVGATEPDAIIEYYRKTGRL